MSATAGVSLLELLVVLALLGILLSLSTVAIPREEAVVVNTASRVAAAQLESARVGRPVQISDDSGRAVLVLPDGSVLGPRFDPLSGAPNATR